MYYIPTDLLLRDMWHWERIVLGMWMLTTLVLTRSYGGNLMSLLAVRYIPQPYQSLRDVLDDPTVTMIWEANSAYVQYYRVSIVMDLYKRRDFLIQIASFCINENINEII